MKDYFYQELKTVSNGLVQNEDNINNLLESAFKISALAEMARNDGLLSLEDAVENLKEDSLNDYLKELVLLVVDGCAPDFIENFGMLTYSSSGFLNIDSIKYLMYLQICLEIQAGTHPTYIKKLIAAMLPVNVRRLYLEAKEDSGENSEENSEKNSEVEEADPIKDKLLYKCIMGLDNKNAQRFLKDVNKRDLINALAVMPEPVQNRLLENLSKNNRKEIEEELMILNVNMSVLEDAYDAEKRMFEIMKRLEERAEIFINA